MGEEDSAECTDVEEEVTGCGRPTMYPKALSTSSSSSSVQGKIKAADTKRTIKEKLAAMVKSKSEVCGLTLSPY
jgi:hypothetical protein